MKKLISVAITGSAASGKSTVCKYLTQKGIKVINADEMAKKAVTPDSPAYKKIIDHFGQEVAGKNGSLNRQKLREIITQSDAARKKLEEIIHPEVLNEIFSEIESFKSSTPDPQKPGLIITEIPLLFELGLEHRFDHCILVFTDREILIERLSKRDNVSTKDAEKLLNIQMPNHLKKERADFILFNNSTTEDLYRQTDEIISGIVNA